MNKCFAIENFPDLPHTNYKSALSDAEALGRSIAPFLNANSLLLLGSLGLIEDLRESVEQLREEIEELQSVNRTKEEVTQI